MNTFEFVWSVLKKESVRGSVIIACAIHEEKLEKILKNRLIKCHDKKDYLFSGGNAPIGTMSSKIDLAYRVGCISSKMRESLHIVRRLRNDFAHISVEIDFDTPSVKDRTFNLIELNRDFVALIWEGIRPEMFAAMGVPNPPDYQNVVDDMVQYAGARYIFEVWASAFAAHLDQKASEINGLESA